MTLDPKAPSLAIEAGVKVAGSVDVPASKSVTNRALNLALLAEGATEIVNPLIAEDTLALMAALEVAGRKVEREEGRVVVRAGERTLGGTIDCGASGTMLRFLTASLSTEPGRWVLDGTRRLRERPVGPLVDALRDLGARIDCLGAEGHAPLRVEGGTLLGGATSLDASASSQYLSSLLMAATRARHPVTLERVGLTSAPYVVLTKAVMEQFGAQVDGSGARLSMVPQRIAGCGFEVEGDYSSAAYFAAAALLTSGSVTLRGLRRDSAQGDARFLDALERMGAEIAWSGDELTVTGTSDLRGIEESFADLPDQAPTLAVLAPFARGRTVIADIGHLRLKESDRLAGVAGALERVGVPGVVETAEALEIPGAWSAEVLAGDRVPAEPLTLDPADDHRMAMSFAVLGLKRPGLSIAEPQVVEKSYPAFWSDLGAVTRA